MKKSLIAAAALMAVLWITPAKAQAGPAPAPVPVAGSTATGGYIGPWPWILIGCVGGTVLSAVDANWRYNRQLTAPEAASCGVMYVVNSWRYEEMRYRRGYTKRTVR